MTLIARISRLFTADIHGILDSLEDPEVILKQAVREMESEIEQSTVRLKDLNKQQEQYLSAGARHHTKLEQLDQQLDLAFADNNEHLSKSLISKKLNFKQQLELIESQRQAIDDEKSEMTTKIEEHKEKLKSILDKLALFGDDNSRVRFDPFSDNDSAFNGAITQEEIELAYLQEKQRRSNHNNLGTQSGENL